MSATGSTAPADSVVIGLKFADGSIASIQYLANGSKAFPKERLDIFCGGKILSLDNFRKLRAYGWSGFKSMNLFRQDKGQQACAQAFINSIEQGLPTPIPFDEIEEVTRVTIEIAQEAHWARLKKPCYIGIPFVTLSRFKSIDAFGLAIIDHPWI